MRRRANLYLLNHFNHLKKQKGFYYMISVFIVDDHNLIRAGIRRLLQDVHGIKVIGEAASGEDALSSLKEKPADVVLMDLRMPGMGGLEATKKLLRLNQDIKVIVLTVCEEEPFPSKLLQAGACGYMVKDTPVEEMVEAIRMVHTGKRYISADIAQLLALKHLSNEKTSPFESFSEREMQVALLISQGIKPIEVSVKLSISPKTVNGYRYRIYRKLKINSDVDLVRLAMRHGLVHAEETL